MKAKKKPKQQTKQKKTKTKASYFLLSKTNLPQRGWVSQWGWREEHPSRVTSTSSEAQDGKVSYDLKVVSDYYEHCNIC